MVLQYDRDHAQLEIIKTSEAPWACINVNKVFLRVKPSSLLLCSYDYLTIANDTNHVFGKFCGEKTGKTFIVTGRFLLITFHTDYVVESRGFDINFNPVPLGESFHQIGHRKS